MEVISGISYKAVRCSLTTPFTFCELEGILSLFGFLNGRDSSSLPAGHIGVLTQIARLFLPLPSAYAGRCSQVMQA